MEVPPRMYNKDVLILFSTYNSRGSKIEIILVCRIWSLTPVRVQARRVQACE